MFPRLPHVTLALLLATAVAGCGGNAVTASGSMSGPARPQSSDDASQRDHWSTQAGDLCQAALTDGAHQMVRRLDVSHIKAHGRAVLKVRAALRQLGPPSPADATAFDKALKLYQHSAAYHAAAVVEMMRHADGNAAMDYSQGLALADQADAVLVGFGASPCARFGMTG
jgi:hypothetical protein